MSIKWKALVLSITLSALCGCSPKTPRNGGTNTGAVMVLNSSGTLGVAPPNTVKPETNLATRLVKKYPNLQGICDRVGGCQNVTISCTRYDGSGNSNLRNTTFWQIRTDWNGHMAGAGWYDNSRPDVRGAITRAVRDYWEDVSFQHGKKSEPETVYPNSTPCDKDCGQ